MNVVRFGIMKKRHHEEVRWSDLPIICANGYLL